MQKYVFRDNFIALAGPFTDWPELLCPACRMRTLEWGERPKIEGLESVAAREGAELWDGWRAGYFHGELTCARVQCRNGYIVLGEWRQCDEPTSQVDLDDDPYEEGYFIRNILPPFPLFDLPKNTPLRIKALLESASRTLLADANAAANRVRSAIEVFLDDRGVARIERLARPTRAGKKTRRKSLDQRLKDFSGRSPKDEKAGSHLMASKWIGNSGSHGDEPLPLEHVLDGIEIFAHVMYMYYDPYERDVERRSRTITRTKGKPIRH